MRYSAKTSSIEDDTTVVYPGSIEDPWNFVFPKSEEIDIFGNPEAEMSIHEFYKHKLNAKRLGSTKRFDGSKCFTPKTLFKYSI